MLKRYFLFLSLTYVFVFPSLGCFSHSEGPQSKTASQARLNLPNWGVTIDATYDRKLDGIVPGYRILTVALTNRSVDMIKLDPVNDQWFIEDAWGRKQKAIVSLRVRDPRAWTELPPRVKDLVEYPAGVQMGYTQTFDIFFPESIDLDRFRSISFYSAILKQNFDALSSASMERAVPAVDDSQTTSYPEKTNPPLSSGTKKAKTTSKYK
jgi:hypothetical protein